VSAGAEARVLRGSVDTPAERADPVVVLEQVLHTYDLREVTLIDRDGTVLARAGASTSEPESLAVDLEGGARLIGRGPAAIGQDRRVLTALATAALRAHESRTLAAEAAAAAELAASDRAKSVLLAGVGHDLRTPIAAIKLAADALAQDDIGWTAAEQRELVDGIVVSAGRLDELVGNLLDLSRIEAGALAATVSPTAIDGVAAAAVTGLALDGVEVQIPDDLPLVLCDAVLLERVVANLLSNAHRFTPEGVAVVVHAAVVGDRVHLSVVDRGPGVPASDMPLMFDAFQRLGDRSPGGSGVGLAVARAFTQAMQGTLTPSATPGGGLTMTVELPVAAS